MTKIRLIIFLLTLIVVSTLGVFVSLYARGYKFDTKTLRFIPNGLLVVKSDPDGASVYIDGELKTATNNTISLSPGTYDISIKKDGYFTWYKRMVVQKEVVTEASAFLFRSAPSLTPVSIEGVVNPIASSDLSKIAYAILPTAGSQSEKSGLWLIDTLNLPFGFPKDARQITDGDLTNSTWLFSPDGRVILLTTKLGVFSLDTGTFTSQTKRVNIGTKKEEILATWEKEKKIKRANLLSSVPDGLLDILQRKSQNFVFSPDETKILYTASNEAELKEHLIPPLPGSSTQKEERNLKPGSTYVYDLKEDKNFLITNNSVNLNGQPTSADAAPTASLHWFPTSRHLILAQDFKVTIIDFDGTNSQTVYSGSYVAPNAYPYLGTSKLLILTNLGSSNPSANLYSLTLK